MEQFDGAVIWSAVTCQRFGNRRPVAVVFRSFLEIIGNLQLVNFESINGFDRR
jgi:hypothetical protein